MKQDEFDYAVARADRAYAKLVRIRNGIEEVEHDDVLGVQRWHPGREIRNPGTTHANVGTSCPVQPTAYPFDPTG